MEIVPRAVPSNEMADWRLGGSLRLWKKILVNKILLSPIRENKKCPKALPRRESLQVGS